MSQKVAKNGQILSMFVPRKGDFFHFCCSTAKVFFLSKKLADVQDMSIFVPVSGFFSSYWSGFLHCHIMDTEKSSEPMFLI